MPKPDLTVKATGYQWYWGYTYPDQKIDEYTSNILPEAKAKAAGVPYMLASTAPMVVPAGKVVHVLVHGADVIHSFSVPAFGIKIDAVPGRTNDTWFKADQRRHLLRPVLAALRHRPQLHADRGEGGQPGRLRRLGGQQGPASPPPPASNSTAPATGTSAAAGERGDHRALPSADRSRRVVRDYGPRRRRPRTSRLRRTARRPHRRPCALAGLLHPLVPVDQPQGHRHALHHLRHRGGD